MFMAKCVDGLLILLSERKIAVLLKQKSFWKFRTFSDESDSREHDRLLVVKCNLRTYDKYYRMS